MLSERSGRRAGLVWINGSGRVRANGRRGGGSHGCSGSEILSAIPWREGRAIAQLECRRKVHIEPVERFGAYQSVRMIEWSRHQRRSSTFARTLRFSGRKREQETREGARKSPHQGRDIPFMEGRTPGQPLLARGNHPGSPKQATRYGNPVIHPVAPRNEW